MDTQRVDVRSGGGSTFQAEWNGKLVECQGCGELIGFAKTVKGRWVPIDPPEDDGSPVEPHWATCPNASDFKSRK